MPPSGVALSSYTDAGQLVATELPLGASGAVEEQLLFGDVVYSVGAPTLTVQEPPDPPALHAPDHTLMQN